MDEYTWDNLGKKIPQDSSKISLTEPWEVEYWTRTLHCTENQLHQAVNAVGHSASAVKSYLQTHYSIY